MGKSLTYCFKCSRLIREEEFVKGKAFNLGDRVCCSACARETGAVVVPGEAPPPPPPPPMPTPTPRKVLIIREPASGTKPAMLIALGAFAAVTIVIAVSLALFSGGDPSATLPEPAASSPRDIAARQALESARKVGGDVKAKRLAMGKVASDYADTAAGAEAKKDLAVLRDLSRELWQRDLQELELKLREPMARRRFEAVIGILEEAIRRDPDPGWADPLRKRLDEVRKESVRIDPDLVGHWKFDEGQGTTVKDDTGRAPPAPIKDATWVDGRIGKALRFSGNGSHVELPNTPELDSLHENNYTVAAWVRPETDPGRDPYAIVMKETRHIGLVMRPRFGMDHWFADGTNGFAGFLRPEHPAGRFYHVAGVIDRTKGLSRIVVDGKELGTKKFPPGAKAWDMKQAHWRFGTGNLQPDKRWAWQFNGIIDDVRFYKRALTDDEIQQLIPD